MKVLATAAVTSALLAAGRSPEEVSVSTATGAATVQATTTASECQPAEHLVDTFTAAQLPRSFGSCALVGSGGSLKGRGIGDQIDQHDTVIRVNRVPSELYFSDLGAKTDVFYSNSATDTYPAGELGVWVTRMVEGLSIGEKLWCRFEDPIGIPENCPFRHLIVARSTKYGLDRVGERDGMPFTIEDDNQPPFAVSHPSLALEAFYWNTAPMQGFYISGGLKAFFTVAPMCDSITLYGFAGSGNVDNHTIDTVHSFETEHEWLHRIAVGDVRDSDFRAMGVSEWLWQNGLFDSVLEAEVKKELPSVIEGLKNRVGCMGEQGNIHIDGWTPPARDPALLEEQVDQEVQRLAERHTDLGVLHNWVFPVPGSVCSAVGVMIALLISAALGRRMLRVTGDLRIASQSDSGGSSSGPLL